MKSYHEITKRQGNLRENWKKMSIFNLKAINRSFFAAIKSINITFLFAVITKSVFMNSVNWKIWILKFVMLLHLSQLIQYRKWGKILAAEEVLDSVKRGIILGTILIKHYFTTSTISTYFNTPFPHNSDCIKLKL